MRIVIDCFKQIKGVGKSIGIYNVTLRLVHSLVEEKKITKNADIRNSSIIVLGNEYNRRDFQIDGVEFISVKEFNPKNKLHCILWELVGVSYVCKKMKANCVLFPRGFCALTHPVKDIVLIHDMIPFYYHEKYPSYFSRLENIYIMNRLKASAKRAKYIITISEASKADIIKYCHVEDQKIKIIYNSCNAIYYQKNREFFSNPYICAITSKLPHKNAQGIIEAYSVYREMASCPMDLVVIGIEDRFIYGLPNDIKSHITCYKYIENNNDVYRIIANSTVFLFLSFVEGFGLPPIEAMQLEVPVICSNTSSLPEVVGDAAILVDPSNNLEVANAIIQLQNDYELQKHIVKSGTENVKRFMNDDFAKKYWDVILENIGD